MIRKHSTDTRGKKNDSQVPLIWRPALGWPAPLLLPMAAWAADEKPKLDTGDTAWMLTSTALVLMMTIPGLALFYGGMVRKKNVLATVMQSFAVTCLVTVLWMVIGYSLAFTSGSTVHRRHEPRLPGGHDARLGARSSPRRFPNRSSCASR